MKLSRLIGYAAAGIIGGLLFENRFLVTKMHSKEKYLKRKLEKQQEKEREREAKAAQ